MKCYFFLLALLLSACTSEPKKDPGLEWITLGTTRLQVPADWTQYKIPAIEGPIYGLTDGTDTLFVSYGEYSTDISAEDNTEFKYAIETINGYRARIAVPFAGTGTMMLFLHEDNDSKLTISGNNIQHADQVLQIFRSVMLKGSDTTKNKHLSLDSFTLRPTGSGKRLFQMNCASCHAYQRESDAPPFKIILQNRTEEWIYQYLTNRKAVGIDSTSVKLIKKYGHECIHFPTFTREDVAALIDYL